MQKLINWTSDLRKLYFQRIFYYYSWTYALSDLYWVHKRIFRYFYFWVHVTAYLSRVNFLIIQTIKCLLMIPNQDRFIMFGLFLFLEAYSLIQKSVCLVSWVNLALGFYYFFPNVHSLQSKKGFAIFRSRFSLSCIWAFW